jgi:predicted ABC-type transport system involved in lysophospholipase L1 biosynthesis ATPase subunit
MRQASSTPAGLLRVDGIYKSFASPGGSIQVLNGVDMQVAEQEFVAIVGQSGSGKSTLLHVLGTLEPADAGEVYLNGQKLFGMPASEMAALRNRLIGFVYQAHHLIPELTALENVMMPLLVRGENRGKALERAGSLLARLGLANAWPWRVVWSASRVCCLPMSRPAIWTSIRHRMFFWPCDSCAGKNAPPL